MRDPAAIMAEAARALPISTLPKPKARSSRDSSGRMKMAPTLPTKVSEPEATGLRPRPICSIKGSR